MGRKKKGVNYGPHKLIVDDATNLVAKNRKRKLCMCMFGFAKCIGTFFPEEANDVKEYLVENLLVKIVKPKKILLL